MNISSSFDIVDRNTNENKILNDVLSDNGFSLIIQLTAKKSIMFA
jgi:hypothetical protein